MYKSIFDNLVISSYESIPYLIRQNKLAGYPLRIIFVGSTSPEINLLYGKDSDSFYDIQPEFNKEMMDRIADEIETYQRAGRIVVVHCVAGRDRSAIAIVWFLHKKMKMSIEEAYSFLESKWRLTRRNLHWFGGRS